MFKEIYTKKEKVILRIIISLIVFGMFWLSAFWGIKLFSSAEMCTIPTEAIGYGKKIQVENTVYTITDIDIYESLREVRIEAKKL